jgi:hypothetical protein
MAQLNSKLTLYLTACLGFMEAIPDARKAKLGEIAGFVGSRVGRGDRARLTFICTHNSRRSQMAQIWAQAAATWYGVKGVSTFSGGTEATSFNPRAVAALGRAGFTVEKKDAGENPVYCIGYAAETPSIEAFSKVIDGDPNPREGFCAVMTCSNAEKNCPVVFGSAKRVVLPYEDPKAFDGTDRESLMYDERCRQISNEMLYLFSQVRRG